MTAKVSKKNSFSTLSYQVLWLGSGIRLPRTIPLGPPLLKLFLPNTGFSDAVKHECEFENIAIYHIPDIQGDITIDETTNNVYDSKGIKIGKAELYE